ncbi:hypothetical protein CSOJ01_12378, partial [Colletotrichum sojae]
QSRGGRNHTDPHEQAGLEVVPQEQLKHSPEWSAPQVIKRPMEYHHYDGKEVVQQDWNSHKIPVAELPHSNFEEKPPTTDRRRKRMWYIIGGVIFLFIAAAAIVGGILGSKAIKASQVDSPGAAAGETGEPQPTQAPSSPSPTQVANTTTKLQSMRQGSSLAVTGWRKPGGTEILLFYQDDDNEVRRSRYDDTQASTSENKSWQAPIKYNSFAGESSSLAGTVIQYGEGYSPQTELFYSNDDNRLLGVSINDNLSPSYEEDSIKNMLLTTAKNSSVAAYWPWVIYQGPDGGLVEVRNRLRAEFSPAAEWDAKKLSTTVADGSSLAVVPVSANFSKLAIQGGYGIFYETLDSRLGAVVPDLNSENLPENYAESWPSTFPSISLPEGNPFTAFSVARPSDFLQRVNTYVLYLDASSDINVVFTDSSSWKTTKPEVLRGVDPDTDIACMTMATTHRDSSQSEVPLEGLSGDTRCYFQRGGLVREVVFNGAGWVDIGNVPIP